MKVIFFLIPVFVTVAIIISGELFKLLSGLKLNKTFLVILNDIGKLIFNSIIIFGMGVLLLSYKEYNNLLALESVLHNLFLLLYFVIIFLGASIYIWFIYKKIYSEYSITLIPQKGTIHFIFKYFLIVMFFNILYVLFQNILFGNISEYITANKEFGLFATLLAPFSEEILFRFGLYLLFVTTLKKIPKLSDEKNRIISLLLMTVIFVMLHGKFSITVFLLSMILIGLMEKTKSIGAPIMLHLMYNLSLRGFGLILQKLL